MASIIVKTEGKIACYVSGSRYKYNPETKKHTKVERTKEEEIQSCYGSLIRDIKRNAFDKAANDSRQ